MSEAFVYLWYDAPNKKYYLGKHKGTPDDSYTHSSSVWESFTKDTIPEGVSRRILAYGTDEEMCILENKLLVNRKKRCWDRYYNNGVGDPRYVDQFGENNHMYGNHEKRPEHSKIMKEKKHWSGENNPGWRHGNYAKDPKAHKKAYMNEYMKSPKYKEYRKAYYQSPEYKAKRKERYWADLEYRQKNLERMKRRRDKKKAERQGVGTLEDFFA